MSCTFLSLLKLEKGYDKKRRNQGLATKGGSERQIGKGILCYGYRVMDDENLLVYYVEAVIDSVTRLKIPSPTGKNVWGRETIAKICRNKKHVGDVALGKTQV